MSEFFEAHCRYQGYRDAAYHRTWELWKKAVGPDLRIMPINENALSFWRIVWQSFPSAEDGGFNWEEAHGRLWNRPNRYEVAVWSGPVLCGLALGHTSPEKQDVCINLLERLSVPGNPLIGYIAPIVFTAASFYGNILKSQRLKIKNPVDGALPYYEKLGFSLAERVDGSTYYAKEIEK